MSHLVSADALLLSPLADSFSLYSPSPTPSTASDPSLSSATMLRVLSEFDPSQPDQRCFPTHQVFSLAEKAKSLAPQQECSSLSINPSVVIATKRSASPAPPASKKPRTAGERVHSKDFIPPDVSGLSKREARLVKNRAAAFLSRQRKREEFETMELRVAELEQENARLLALTQTPTQNGDLHSEVEHLRAQLAAALERERELSEQLISHAAAASPVTPSPVKVEESQKKPFTLPALSRPSAPLKSGASLGLMVLLCALPTLLSMPMKTAMPTSFAIPNPPLTSPSPVFDFNSFLPNEYGWTVPSTSNMMDLDDFQPSSTPSTTSTQKLELSTSGVPELDTEAGLSGLDISFDATPSDNGRIRVRIHPSSSVSSRATSPGPSSVADTEPSDPERQGEGSLLASSLAALSSSLAQLSYPPPSSPSGDPFLGVGAIDDFSGEDMFAFDDPSSEVMYPSSSETAKKRVRIALKSLPTAGGEGGEWEVEVC